MSQAISSGGSISAAVADHFGLASELLLLRGAQPRRRADGLLHDRAATPPMMATEPQRLRPRWRLGASICAIRRCAPPSASASASCSPSSARSLIVNFVLVREPLVARPHGARLRLLRVPALDRHDADGRPHRAMTSARGRRFGDRWRLLASDCRCCWRRARRWCSPEWCWSPSGHSSRRRSRPASSGKAATADRGAASGIYLACYFFGGLVGSAVLGQLFDRIGWAACVAGIALALTVAALLAARLRLGAR